MERAHAGMGDSVAATGYKADLARLPFLDGELRDAIEQVEGTPVLNDNFETSLPGLYFLGLSAANSFGPLLRFMVGAEFAAGRGRLGRLGRAERRRLVDHVGDVHRPPSLNLLNPDDGGWRRGGEARARHTGRGDHDFLNRAGPGGVGLRPRGIGRQ